MIVINVISVVIWYVSFLCQNWNGWQNPLRPNLSRYYDIFLEKYTGTFQNFRQEGQSSGRDSNLTNSENKPPVLLPK